MLSPIQARASGSFEETKAAVYLRWLHAGHTPPHADLRMHSALRSLGASKEERPRTLADFRANWQPRRMHPPKGAFVYPVNWDTV